MRRKDIQPVRKNGGGDMLDSALHDLTVNVGRDLGGIATSIDNKEF